MQTSEQIFNTQRANLEGITKTKLTERIQKLNFLKEIILAEREELTQAVYLDFKRPHVETDLLEILPTLSCLNHVVKHLPSWTKDVKVSGSPLLLGTSSYIRYEAKGQVLIIAPWNYPLSLVLIPMIEALSAGNAVMIKPSEFTPHSNQALKRLLSKVFLPEEVSLIEGDAKVSQELLSLPFHHIFFTGSTQVGKVVMEAASKNLASVTLELGGKSPTIIEQDADIKDAAKKIMWGKLINAGQTCIAPDYVLIHESKEAEFVQECKRIVDSVYAKKESFASIINLKHFERVCLLVEQAKNLGAEVIGFNTDKADLKIFPTLLRNVPQNAKILDEEIFGPILPILTFKESKEVTAFIQSKTRPLALYIFCENEKKIEDYLASNISGGVAVNDVVMHIANHNLPFGGINHSGIGSYHGHYGFKTFSHERAVLNRSHNLGMDYFYPPYSDSKKTIIDTMLKKLSSIF